MKKINFLFSDFERLSKTVDKIYSIIEKNENIKAPPKNISFKGAIDFFKEKGIMISESKLYKITAKREIPFYRFNNKLIFNTGELERWIEDKIVSPYQSKQKQVCIISNSCVTKINKKIQNGKK